MGNTLATDICVVGAGAAGLSVSAGAAMLGAKVVLVEKEHMGGDCLNYGCIPSKSLIAASRMAVMPKHSREFGVELGGPKVDFEKVQQYVRSVIEKVAPTDSESRYRAMGVNVVKGHASFSSPDEIVVGEQRICAKRFVIATGSKPLLPPITGLESIPFLTNETIFTNTQLPEHLIIIGGGPVGMELAQAHFRLGSRVTVLDQHEFLSTYEPELVEILVTRIRSEGIDTYGNVAVQSVRPASSGGLYVAYKQGGDQKELHGSHLLVVTGRGPNVEGVGLDRARVKYSHLGIQINSRLRTSNRRIYAAGDVLGGPMFTHAASYHADIIIRNILFRLPAKARAAIPSTVYTAPELASIGLRESDMAFRQKQMSVLRWPLAENDRARTESQAEGLIKLVVDRRGRVMGAHILAPNAGDLIVPWVMAVARSDKLSNWASMVIPYPTFSEIGKRAAGSYYQTTLSSNWVKGLVKLLMKFG